jgi:ZIP family zinc transporter
MHAKADKLPGAAGGKPFALTLRRVLGLLICVAGCALLLSAAFRQLLRAGPAMHAALVGGGTAAAATALGTVPVLFSQHFTQRTYDSFLGFGAGVMLGASAFSLVVPALAAAHAGGASAWGAGLVVAAGLLGGAGLLLALGRALDPGDVLAGETARTMRRAWLFVWAVALHNLPEGMAIGVAYAGVDLDKANSLATGVSIQDVPEGLVVALALRTVGHGRLLSVALGVASGLIEPVAAAAGVGLIGLSQGVLPLALAGAAGAMLFVIVNDVIPESHRNGNGTFASLALVAGFVVMTVLDTSLG